MENCITELRKKLYSVIEGLSVSLDGLVRNPGKDFVRTRKLPFAQMMKLLVNIGGGSLGSELLEANGFSTETPTVSAFVQQRQKILPLAVYEMFRKFTASLDMEKTYRGYKILAVDGSHLAIAPDNSDAKNFFQRKDGGKGYSMLHLNALYDVLNNVYVDAEIQNAREQNEFRALTDMAKRAITDSKTIILADRGYESYNIFANIQSIGANFIIRAKDLGSRGGILSAAKLPSSDEFDIVVTKILSRKYTKNCEMYPQTYRHLRKDTTFDMLSHGSEEEYIMTFRALRFKNADNSYECVITNLPKSEFSDTTIKEIYRLRWGIETSFRWLKHTIGLTHFHSKNRDSIKQEIYARMTMFNFAQQIVNCVESEDVSPIKNKYRHRINFAVAVCICRHFISASTDIIAETLAIILKRYTLPVRQKRLNPRVVNPQSYVPFNYRRS